MEQELYFLGISSGVLCVIFGIYDKLIESVLGIFHNFKKNFLFLLPLIIGGIIGIILLGNILKFLFSSYPMQTNYAFMGLILGSVPLLIKEIHKKNPFHIHYLIYALLSFAIGLFMVLLENHIDSTVVFNFGNTNNTILSPYIIFLILSGFFMSIGIVIPRS